MFIQPIGTIATLEDLTKVNDVSAAQQNQIPFKNLVMDAVNDVKEADSALQTEIYKLTTGQSDDLHSANNASTKLGLALDMVIQLRNKSLDAYNEIMRMSV